MRIYAIDRRLSAATPLKFSFNRRAHTHTNTHTHRVESKKKNHIFLKGPCFFAVDFLAKDVVQDAILLHMSRVVRKPAFCICENKDADQLS